MSMFVKERLKVFVRRLMFHYPALYYFRYQLRGRGNKLVTTKDKDIVIEGVPRTANTFMTESFSYIQKKPLKMAHHMHVPGQLIRAAQWGLPAVLLIRQPMDTVLSHFIAHKDRTDYTLKACLHYYIDFHRPLMSLRNKFVVAEFQDVVDNPDKIIALVNQKFKVNFDNYTTEHPFEKETINQRIDMMYKHWGTDKGLSWFGNGVIDEKKVSRPSEHRNKLKQEYLQILKAREYGDLVGKAQEVYEYFLKNK